MDPIELQVGSEWWKNIIGILFKVRGKLVLQNMFLFLAITYLILRKNGNDVFQNIIFFDNFYYVRKVWNKNPGSILKSSGWAIER